MIRRVIVAGIFSLLVSSAVQAGTGKALWEGLSKWNFPPTKNGGKLTNEFNDAAKGPKYIPPDNPTKKDLDLDIQKPKN